MTLNGCWCCFTAVENSSRCVQTFPVAALCYTNKKTKTNLNANWNSRSGDSFGWWQAGLPVIRGGPALSNLGGNVPFSGCKYLGLFTESFTTHLFLHPSQPRAFCFCPRRVNSPGLSPALTWLPDHGLAWWLVCWGEPRRPRFLSLPAILLTFHSC